jgi:sialidase-1
MFSKQSSRILFSAHRSRAFVYFSDDFGKTYQMATKEIDDLDECSMAFSPMKPLDVLLNCRLHSRALRGQTRLAYDASDANYSVAALEYNPSLVDPNCQGSLISHAGNILLSNINSTRVRASLTIKCSKDEGHSWSAGQLVWAKSAAYSQLVSLSNSSVGVLFEKGNTSPYETISFATVSISGC